MGDVLCVNSVVLNPLYISNKLPELWYLKLVYFAAATKILTHHRDSHIDYRYLTIRQKQQIFSEVV